MHALPSPKVASRILPLTARALPYRRALFTPCVGPCIYSRRSFATSSPRRNEKVLQVKKTSEKSTIGAGAEGLHIRTSMSAH